MSFKISPLKKLIKKTKGAYLAHLLIPALFFACCFLFDSDLRGWLAGLFAFFLLFFHSPSVAWLGFLFALSFFYFPPSFSSESGYIWPFRFIILSLAGFFGFLLFRLCLSLLLFKLLQRRKGMSQTAHTAFIGSPWMEREFFTGRPDFKNMLNQPFPSLSAEERDFLNKETEELCGLSSEWELMKRRKLSQTAEDFLKKERFFGLAIPKAYQGRGDSPFAHAKVIEKLSSHNVPLAVIVMAPNALGPAQLLLKYGSPEQKSRHLSNLALGRDIPCFGLTEIEAGSDAGSIKSEGVLFQEGDQLKIRLNWEKRWITLASKATLFLLVVQLKDPERLYSKKEFLGMTCLLAPGEAPGVERALLHDPMGLPIGNAPVTGKDVVVSAEEAVIGGAKNMGKGWAMIMETLSLGRGISMPSLAVGCGKKISWLTGAHALVRKQFGSPIGKFEGVEEALSHIAGLTHLMETAQIFTLSGLNQGICSSVATALTKCNLTEMAQKISKKGMDIMGGIGLSLGPKNKIAQLYMSLPLAVTVEGANILTRTFIVYGQSFVKLHPSVEKITAAVRQSAFKSFHRGLWDFIYSLICHFVRGAALTVSGGWLFWRSRPLAKEHRYLQKIAWASSLFAFFGDLSFIIFGGLLKTKGRLTGRLSDWLSFQYMAIALIWRWRQNGSSKKSWIKAQWGLEYCFFNIQKSAEALLNNYPQPLARLALKPLLWLLRVNPIGCPPSDSLGKRLAAKLMTDEEFRGELCSGIYFPKESQDQFQKLRRAYRLSLKEAEILEKIRRKSWKKISSAEAFNLQYISLEERNILQEAKQAQKEAIQVDAFSEKEYFGPYANQT